MNNLPLFPGTGIPFKWITDYHSTTETKLKEEKRKRSLHEISASEKVSVSISGPSSAVHSNYRNIQLHDIQVDNMDGANHFA